jgi:DNA-binding MarR family transcriptional regulator
MQGISIRATMDGTIGNMLAQVSRLLRRSFDQRARDIGVTRPQWQVLGVLAAHEGIKQTGLADILEVEPITAGRMIDRLQEQNLVERRADPADRRAWRLYLTARGRELSDTLLPLNAETYAIALEGVSEEDRDRLRKTLATMLENLKRRTGLH